MCAFECEARLFDFRSSYIVYIRASAFCQCAARAEKSGKNCVHEKFPSRIRHAAQHGKKADVYAYFIILHV